jgi:hypothetical protein
MIKNKRKKGSCCAIQVNKVFIFISKSSEYTVVRNTPSPPYFLVSRIILEDRFSCQMKLHKCVEVVFSEKSEESRLGDQKLFKS